MEHPSIRLPEGRLTPFGPSVELDRAVIASALAANPRAGEALALAASAIVYFRQHREQLLAFAEVVTDLADLIDGDPDFEDATDAEDDHALSPQALTYAHGPGCTASDPMEHDGTEADSSYTEWQTRGRHKLAGDGSEPFDRSGEDSELAGDETDGQFGEDEECASFAIKNGYPGCPVSDPGGTCGIDC